jgi:hypothetical protein
MVILGLRRGSVKVDFGESLVAIYIECAYNVYMTMVLTTMLVVTLGVVVALWLLTLLGR